ncbi:MAG: serine/threonine-protein kinase, partial [Planctomycetota bacterium]|nr:serine/threonine-protein kinase [Planctomycetota bacterium]
MTSLSLSDLAFAKIAVQKGAVSFKELDQIIQDVNNGLVLRREDESLGPYLARTGQITVQQLYEIALEVTPSIQSDDGSRDSKKHKVDHPFGLILTNLTDPDIKAEAAMLVAQLRNIALDQATGLCSSSVVPAMTRLSRDEADSAKDRFHKIGVECRVIKWKRNPKDNNDSRPGSKRVRVISGRQPAMTDSENVSTDISELSRSTSSRMRPVFVTPENAPNPFAEPVETFDQDPLENTNSISEDSVDFLVVGSNESDVIFLEAPADDNTATAVTVFSQSALDPGNDSLLAKPKRRVKASPRQESSLGIDSVVGGFRLTKLLGKGGFAKVYLGEHTVLGHKAAVKVYKTRDSKLLRRITRREATLISRLRHPRLVSILNVGQEAGSFFIIMEYVPGIALGQYVKDHGPLSPKRAATVIRDIAEALNFIHRNGLVHRDVKPSNFLLEDNGRARLLDFELIKSFSDQLNESLPDDAITQSGQLIGTPRFMSPEQIDDVHTIRPTSDVYSLGAAFYYMITGRHPYNGKSLIQIIKEVLIKEAPPPSEFCENLPASLESFIQRMMDKDPANRPQSMSEVIETLEKLDLAAQAHAERPEAPPTRRMRLPRTSTRVTGVYRLPTDTVFFDEGSQISKPMFPNDETETDAQYKAVRYREDLGSTIVSNDLNVGKINNNTVISNPTMLGDELDSVVIAKKWEELKNHERAAKELLLS